MATNTVTLLNGTTADATQVEAKVNPLYTSIDNSNISAGAGIVFSKLDSTTVAGVSATQTLTNKTLTAPQITGAGAGKATLQYANSASSRTVTIPDPGGNDTLVALAATQTLSNKTINGDLPIINAGDVNVYSDSGSTLKFKVDGATGDFGIASGARFFLSGTSLNPSLATFISELSAGSGIIFMQAAGNALIHLDGNGSPDNRGLFPAADGFIRLGDDPNRWLQVYSYTGNFEGNVVLRQAGDLKIYSDGEITKVFEVDGATGEMLLGDVDPPTANYGNRNSLVKGWAHIDGTGAIVDSYNVSSANRSAAGTYTVTWNTDFANSNYSAVVTPIGANGVVVLYSGTIFNKASNGVSVAIAQIDAGGVIARVDLDFCIMAIGNQ